MHLNARVYWKKPIQNRGTKKRKYTERETVWNIEDACIIATRLGTSLKLLSKVLQLNI